MSDEIDPIAIAAKALYVELPFSKTACIAGAHAVIAALKEEGWKLMRREPSEQMIAAALPLANMEPSPDDKRLGARACMLLSGSLNIPDEGNAVVCAAQMAVDYRALFDSAPTYTHPAEEKSK